MSPPVKRSGGFGPSPAYSFALSSPPMATDSLPANSTGSLGFGRWTPQETGVARTHLPWYPNRASSRRFRSSRPFFTRGSPQFLSLPLARTGRCSPPSPGTPVGGAVSLWNLGDGTPARPFHAADAPSNWASILSSVAFSPRGDLMAAGLAGGNLDGVLVWDVATRELRRTLRPGFGDVFNVGFSVDGKYLACACREGVVVFDTANFERHLFARGGGQSGQSWNSTFSPDSKLLAIPAPESGVVRLWNITTNHEITVPTVRDPVGPPFVSFIATASAWFRPVAARCASGISPALARNRPCSDIAAGFPVWRSAPTADCLDRPARTIRATVGPGTGRVVRELRGFDARRDCRFRPGRPCPGYDRIRHTWHGEDLGRPIRRANIHRPGQRRPRELRALT